MSEVVRDNNGTIDKYIGDAIMTTFGIIDPDKGGTQKDAQNALKCAFRMKVALEEFNKKSDYPDIHFGIGINTGDVVVGNIGSEYRWDYTIIGEAVNVTARIEHLTRESQNKSTILIGEETFNKTKEIIEEYKQWDPKEVKGIRNYIQVYEVMKLKDEF
jgi:adenylate cyclase